MKVGVRIDGVAMNPESRTGLFWFGEDSVAIIPTDKTGHVILPEIQKVIFNGPKTIILWNDGTKTIVSCGEGELYDRYDGFCAAVTKKVFGSTSRAKKVLLHKANTFSEVITIEHCATTKAYEKFKEASEYWEKLEI